MNRRTILALSVVLVVTGLLVGGIVGAILLATVPRVLPKTALVRLTRTAVWSTRAVEAPTVVIAFQLSATGS